MKTHHVLSLALLAMSLSMLGCWPLFPQPTPTSAPTSTSTPIPTETPVPTETLMPTPALPTYSEILKTYPKDAELCATDADLVGVEPDGRVRLTGELSFTAARGIEYKCYGTKITVMVKATLDGTTYDLGTKLTVDKNLDWIEVSSWQ